jgi:hypothetical protein
MKNYYFTMLRTYETLIEVQAETPEQAIENFKSLGDSIYRTELEQICITEQSLTFKDGISGNRIIANLHN